MAEKSTEERTVPASPRRKQQARERGQVVRSKELSSSAVLLAGAILALATGGKIYDFATHVMANGLAISSGEAFHTQQMLGAGFALIRDGAIFVLPLFLIVLVAGSLGGIAIGGWNFSGQALVPDLSRINPAEGIKRIFSVHGLGELAKAVLKLLLIGAAAFIIGWLKLNTLIGLENQAPHSALIHAGILFARFFLYIAAATVLILAFDIPFQIWQYNKQLRMTRQEAKDDMKETEGRPEVRQRIRRMQQERARQRMMSEVPKADVIVTNPTHYAVALRYQPDRRRAPVVVAKGAEELARRIRDLASENRVPILEAPALARSLYRHVPLDGEIPGALYQAVARVLAHVYQLRTGQRPDPLGDVPVPPGFDPEAEVAH